jgi:membrane protease subunit HflC
MLPLLALVAAAVAVALVWVGELGIGPVVITREGEQKLVLQFGRPRLQLTEPGLALRIPLVEEVRVFDARLLYLDSDPQQIQTRDEEPLAIDNYVTWRIANPLLFYQSFPRGREGAEAQIDRTVDADVRDVIGQNTLDEVLTGRRVEIMNTITTQSREALEAFGIAVVDVRLNRTELPPGTEENVFARMRTERERLARKLRAEGDEAARQIRADADRNARVIVAEATRDSEILRGEGDAEAAGIYAEAYESDADFYGFVRSLEAYRKTIGEGTTLVLPPDHEFFRILGGSPDSPSTAAPAVKAPPPVASPRRRPAPPEPKARVPAAVEAPAGPASQAPDSAPEGAPPTALPETPGTGADPGSDEAEPVSGESG